MLTCSLVRYMKIGSVRHKSLLAENVHQRVQKRLDSEHVLTLYPTRQERAYQREGSRISRGNPRIVVHREEEVCKGYSPMDLSVGLFRKYADSELSFLRWRSYYIYTMVYIDT